MKLTEMSGYTEEVATWAFKYKPFFPRVHALIHIWLNRGDSPDVIVKVLSGSYEHMPKIASKWPYLDKAVQQEQQKHNSRNHEKEHNSIKRDFNKFYDNYEAFMKERLNNEKTKR